MLNNEIPWTFKTWIVNFKDVDLPIGDLSKAIIKDPDFPDEDLFGAILEHIANSDHYKRGALETFCIVWHFYRLSS